MPRKTSPSDGSATCRTCCPVLWRAASSPSAIIKAGDIAYQFREMLIIPEDEGDELDSLDEVLKVILAGNDRIIGSDRADTLIGLTGGDRLDGHRGDDVLIGGAGADRLSGGGGSDTFVVDILPTSGRRADTIKDFNPEKDQIALDHLVFTEIGNRLSPREFHVGTEATHKSEYQIRGARSSTGTARGKPIREACDARSEASISRPAISISFSRTSFLARGSARHGPDVVAAKVGDPAHTE